MKNKILIIPTVHNVNECAVINALYDKLAAAETESTNYKLGFATAIEDKEILESKLELAEQQLRDIDALDGYLTLTHFNPRKRVINYCDVRAILNRT